MIIFISWRYRYACCCFFLSFCSVFTYRLLIIFCFLSSALKISNWKESKKTGIFFFVVFIFQEWKIWEYWFTVMTKRKTKREPKKKKSIKFHKKMRRGRKKTAKIKRTVHLTKWEWMEISRLFESILTLPKPMDSCWIVDHLRWFEWEWSDGFECWEILLNRSRSWRKKMIEKGQRLRKCCARCLFVFRWRDQFEIRRWLLFKWKWRWEKMKIIVIRIHSS